MNPMDSPGPDVPGPMQTRRRRLRAVFAADIANFGGMMTIDETNTVDVLSITRRVAIEAFIPVVGPVARSLVSREALAAVGRDDFYRRLADQIPDERAKARLLAWRERPTVNRTH